MRWSRHARRANEAEFEEFVAASSRSLRRTAYLMCGDWHRAEDIVQTVFVRVYLKWDKIEHTEGPGPYTRRAVVNAAIDESRKPWRRERAVAEAPDFASRNDHAVAAADRDEVTQALAALPPRQRAVVILRYAEDHDVDTTADLLGISPGTVKSQAARGLATLRKSMLDPALLATEEEAS